MLLKPRISLEMLENLRKISANPRDSFAPLFQKRMPARHERLASTNLTPHRDNRSYQQFLHFRASFL